MRAFLLIALVAMAATVSCAEVSEICKNNTIALNNAPAVKDAEKFINDTGCKQINFGGMNDAKVCTFNANTFVYTCNCEHVYTNTSAFESAVSAISDRGVCVYNTTFVLTGVLKVNATTNQTITLNGQHTSAGYAIYGKNCTDEDIGTQWTNLAAKETEQFVEDDLNANSAITNVVWLSGTATVSGCGVTRASAPTAIPQATPATPSSTATSTGTMNPSSTATSTGTNNNPSSTGPINPSSTGPNNNNGTTPTGTPAPNTPAPNTPTPTPKPQGGDASSIASSLVLVASLIAATVAIVA